MFSKFSSKVGRVVAGAALVGAASLVVAPAAGAMVNCGCRPPAADQSMVFTRTVNNSEQVFKADQNLSHITQLTQTGENYDPSMNAARTLIAYTSGVNGRPQLFVMNADGSGKRNVINDVSHNYYEPSISPDGTKAVVVSDRSGAAELYVVTLSNGALSQRTFQGVADGANWAPAWSPNGAYIAFTSNRGNAQNIYQMPSTGGSAQRVTYDGSAYDATWSPNSQEIAYSFRAPGAVPEIYWADAFSVNVVHKVSTTDGNWHIDPTWSPDGSSIAFVAEGNTNSIVAAGANGGNQHTIVSSGFQPNWGFPIQGPVAQQ
jgi:TolB protein